MLGSVCVVDCTEVSSSLWCSSDQWECDRVIHLSLHWLHSSFSWKLSRVDSQICGLQHQTVVHSQSSFLRVHSTRVLNDCWSHRISQSHCSDPMREYLEWSRVLSTLYFYSRDYHHPPGRRSRVESTLVQWLVESTASMCQVPLLTAVYNCCFTRLQSSNLLYARI